jgi:hypothetical protein
VAGAALATAAGGAALLWLPRALTQAPAPEPETVRSAGRADPVEEFLAVAPAGPDESAEQADRPEDAEVIEVLDWLAELGEVDGGRG